MTARAEDSTAIHPDVPMPATGQALERPGPGRLWTLRLGFYGPIVGLMLAMFQEVPREVVGAAGLGLMMVLLLMKVPVAIAMIAAASVGILVLGDTRVLASTFRTVPYSSVASWSLSVVPMFVLMGLLLWRSGASERLYDASRHWIGWVPGGLAVGTNFAGAGLAAVSGSTLGVTYALGRIGVPEMLRAGYDPRYATSSVLMAGTGGQLIPPSIFLVIYAGIASVPVGSQLLAGLLPGIVLALSYGLLLVAIGVLCPALVGRGVGGARVASSWAQRWSAVRRVWAIPVLAVALLAGLYSGLFTATEAGAFGAFGAILVAVGYQGVREASGSISLALRETARATGAIFLLVIAATVLSRFLALSGVASWMVNTVGGLGLGRVQFLLVLLVLYLVLGMFMDPLTMMLITVPILMPILTPLDISLLWFGVFIVLLGELAVITPPVGVLTFVLHKLVQDPEVNLGRPISLREVFVGVSWFLPVSVGVLILLILFPEIAEVLPRMAGDG